MDLMTSHGKPPDLNSVCALENLTEIDAEEIETSLEDAIGKFRGNIGCQREENRSAVFSEVKLVHKNQAGNWLSFTS